MSHRREEYYLVNGKPAIAAFDNRGKLVSFVLQGSHFWSKVDDAWFDVVHRKFGIRSVIVPLKNTNTTYINVHHKDEIYESTT